MNTAAAKLPAWFNQFDPTPTASAKGWLKLRITNGDRQVLLEAQKEHDDLLRQLPSGNPTDLGKQQWNALREEYARTHDARVLDRIDEIGHRGERFAADLRARKHTVRDSARRIAAQKNCRPNF